MWIQLISINRQIPRHADSLGSVSEFDVRIAERPVHAQLLRLQGLPRRLVDGHPAETRVVDPVAIRQVGEDVRLAMR